MSIREIPKDKYLTADEFATRQNVSKSTVYKAIKANRLEAFQIGGMYLIKSNAVLLMQRERHGKFVGMSDLRKGDIEAFLKKRGIRIN